MACKNSKVGSVCRQSESQKISTMMEDHEQAPGPRFRALRSRSVATTASPKNPPSFSVRSHSIPAINPEMTSMVTRSPGIEEDEDMLVPIGCLAIRKSHWKLCASRCATPNCKKPFPTEVHGRNHVSRNCSMCGDVFCRPCTNFNRLLSTNAQPDTLGHPHSVCLACYNHRYVFGVVQDHMGIFQELRKIRVDGINRSEEEQRLKSLCSRRTSESKTKVVEEELNRLLVGYKGNMGKIKEIVSELVIPDWQKSQNWVKDAPSCSNCGISFGVLKRRLHCRVGGQIFCSKCASSELILYVDDEGGVGWALNGKEGGLRSVPEKFQLVIICKNCETEVEDMMRERGLKPPPSIFQGSLNTLHSQLSPMQATIEANLPAYRDLVEYMYMPGNRVEEEEHPMRKLVKAHSDLSDAFSSFAVGSQKLILLKPRSYPEEKLLRNVMLGIHRFYSENMSSFRQLRNHLSQHVPLDTLNAIQLELSLQSIERVHVVMQQLVFETLNLQHKYKFDDGFLSSIITITQYMDIEFREFIEGKGDSWEGHTNLVSVFIKEELGGKRLRLKIDDNIHRQPKVIQYLVVSQCSSLIQELYRELQAKTVDKEFKQVKLSLDEACTELDTLLVQFNTTGRISQ